MSTETESAAKGTSLFVYGGTAILVASSLPGLLWQAAAGSRPGLLPWLQLAALAALFLAGLALSRFAPLRRLLLALAGVTLAWIGTAWLGALPCWREAFSRSLPFTGPVLLKLAAALPVAGLLILLTGSPHKALLAGGDLSVRASRIGWLGIAGDILPWKKLAVRSGLMIMPVTILLALLTTVGFAVPKNLARLPAALPLLLPLAALNAWSEGILFRNAVLAPLSGALAAPLAMLLSALLFGLAHWHGIPGGPLGVAASCLLGWYLARAMQETGGILAPWIIHAMLDTAIFITAFLVR